MHPSMLAGVLAVAALALAGCSGTGNFDVQQTEPFRVQLEGEPQTVVVSEDDSEAKQVVIDTCSDPCGDDGPEEVTVKVQVTPQQAAACVIKVIIKTESGEVLDEREVNAGGSTSTSGSSDTNTSGNATSTTPAASSGGDTNVVIQNIVVNVKGKDNIVVLTQAIEGSADVDISAASARGNADADASIDDEDDGSASTTSSTMTTTSATTNTTS